MSSTSISASTPLDHWDGVPDIPALLLPEHRPAFFPKAQRVKALSCPHVPLSVWFHTGSVFECQLGLHWQELPSHWRLWPGWLHRKQKKGTFNNLWEQSIWDLDDLGPLENSEFRSCWVVRMMWESEDLETPPMQSGLLGPTVSTFYLLVFRVQFSLDQGAGE